MTDEQRLINTSAPWQHGGTSLSIAGKYRQTAKVLPTLTDRLIANIIIDKDDEILQFAYLAVI